MYAIDFSKYISQKKRRIRQILRLKTIFLCYLLLLAAYDVKL